jgi:Fe-S-cluster containining protein
MSATPAEQLSRRRKPADSRAVLRADSHRDAIFVIVRTDRGAANRKRIDDAAYDRLVAFTGMTSRCLDFHAEYRCRHSGVCCRTGWDIPFEPRERQAAEHLRLVPSGTFRDADGISVAMRRDDGSCVFLEDTGAGVLCAIHRASGHEMLPVACRMFPRVAMHDRRGWSITLSHFCPTAASLLFHSEGDAAIVEPSASLMEVGPLDGLDAVDAIPPLLRDGVFMDLESFSEWESRAIRVLTSPEHAPHGAVTRLESITDELARWTPGESDLADAVDRAFNGDIPAAGTFQETVESRAVKRWLAAHLFGNWIAYQGRGLRTIVRYVRACLDVFLVEYARDANALEAIRRSDYLIVHASDSQQLATSIDALLRRGGTQL